MKDIFYPLEQLYKFLYLTAYDITGNYGIALIFLSLFIYIVLFPFNQKAQQIQNMEREVQSIISPQIGEIKKHYRGKEQYEKIQRLYHRYAYHPVYAIRSAAGIVFQIPFFVAARSMLYDLQEIKGVPWGIIQDLGKPDQLLAGINVLPFVMTMVTVIYAFVMPKLSRKEITQTIVIGIVFLIILYPAPAALLIFWTWNLLWSLLHCILFDRIQWLSDCAEGISDIFGKNTLAFAVIIPLALTVGLLIPSEIYIKNASQLWFSYTDIFKYIIKDTVTFAGILFVFNFVCWNDKYKSVYLSVLLGLLFGVFLQSYIIGLNYGTFDGHEIKWEKYTWESVVNMVIWLACLGGAFYFFHRLKFDKDKIKRIVKPITFAIIIIQCAVILFSLVKNPIQKDFIFEDGKAGVLTTKNIYTISAKENIIVFLLDMLDASVFEQIMHNNPEAVKDLKDFSYYPDTTSSYGFTQYSLPEILTGRLFDPRDRYSDYLTKAWNNNPFYKTLKERNYSVSLYTSGSFVDKNAGIKNLVTEKIHMDNNTIKEFNNLVKFRIVPHCIKRLYYNYRAGFQNPTVFNSNVRPYREDDRSFLQGLKTGLKTVDHENAFRFYHLVGMHYPFILNENAEPLKPGETGSDYKQALGSLKIVREFISQMKSLGVYNNATFVILADHGYHNMVGGRPVFLIKRSGEEKDKIVVRNDPKSVSELMPTLFGGYKTSDELKSEVIKTSNDRFFHYEDGYGHFIKYRIAGPAYNINSWIALGEVKRNIAADHGYEIGNLIDFTCFGNSINYKGNGWTEREETFGSFITKKSADLILKINNIKRNNNGFIVRVKGNMYYKRKPYHGRVRLYVNEHCISNWFIKEDETMLTGKLLPEVVKEGQTLLLRFDIDKPSGVEGIDSLVFCVKEVRIVEGQ